MLYAGTAKREISVSEKVFFAKKLQKMTKSRILLFLCDGECAMGGSCDEKIGFYNRWR